jgi:hypothetical protein
MFNRLYLNNRGVIFSCNYVYYIENWLNCSSYTKSFIIVYVASPKDRN